MEETHWNSWDPGVGGGGGLNPCQEGSPWAGLVSQSPHWFWSCQPKRERSRLGDPGRRHPEGVWDRDGGGDSWAFLPRVEGVGGEVGQRGWETQGQRRVREGSGTKPMCRLESLPTLSGEGAYKVAVCPRYTYGSLAPPVLGIETWGWSDTWRNLHMD